MIPTEYTGKSVKIRLARLNSEFRAYYQDENGLWKEEKPAKDMETMGNGIKYPVKGFNNAHFRPESFGLKDSVQVGIITNPGMKASNPFVKFRDSGARFTCFKISEIDSFEECLK